MCENLKSQFFSSEPYLGKVAGSKGHLPYTKGL